MRSVMSMVEVQSTKRHPWTLTLTLSGIPAMTGGGLGMAVGPETVVWPAGIDVMRVVPAMADMAVVVAGIAATSASQSEITNSGGCVGEMVHRSAKAEKEAHGAGTGVMSEAEARRTRVQLVMVAIGTATAASMIRESGTCRFEVSLLLLLLPRRRRLQLTGQRVESRAISSTEFATTAQCPMAVMSMER
ncbi:hypothetical protein GGI24_002737 [Coemansia furcata]|nr:hypothetical protein GGI24_002737 [Coemansia furcata]